MPGACRRPPSLGRPGPNLWRSSTVVNKKSKLWASGNSPAPEPVARPHLCAVGVRCDQRRLITTVPAARSWRPRRSVEMIKGGRASETKNARSSARGRPRGLLSSRTTAIRLSSCPKLPPASQDSTADSTKKTVKIIHARQPPPVSTAVPKKLTAINMHAAQSMIRAPIRARQLASDPRPSRGKPRRWPGYASLADAVSGALSATSPRLPGAVPAHFALAGGSRIPPGSCYMRETFVQLDRNRISIRLSRQPRVEHFRIRPAMPAQR